VVYIKRCKGKEKSVGPFEIIQEKGRVRGGVRVESVWGTSGGLGEKKRESIGGSFETQDLKRGACTASSAG